MLPPNPASILNDGKILYKKKNWQTIYTILVFEELIFRPKNFEKYSIVSSVARKYSWETSRVRDVANTLTPLSAYGDNLC